MKIALIAVAVVAFLAVVFYKLNQIAIQEEDPEDPEMWQ